MTVKVNIANGLKNARKKAGKSVDEVGAILGKSGKTISAWENERGQPDGDELIKICHFLGCHLSDMYGYEYVDYLTQDSEIKELTDDERELVRNFRTLSERGKRALLVGLRDFAHD